MNRSIHSIRKLGLTLRDLCASAVGCFVFTPGFLLVTKGEDGADAPGSTRIAIPNQSPLPGIGAALFLLAFIASEAFAMVSTLRRESTSSTVP